MDGKAFAVQPQIWGPFSTSTSSLIVIAVQGITDPFSVVEIASIRPRAFCF